MQRKPWSETRSYGVACCRYNPVSGRPEILLICKRSTYAFISFALGKYRYNEIRKMFNNMTVEEKLDILSLDFRQIWYRAWANSKYRIGQFISAKARFESQFLMDGGERLKAMIRESSSTHLLWEIPKGHKKGNGEGDLSCALREFEEETGIKKKYYTLLGTTTYVNSFSDEGVKYVSEYFLAAERYTTKPSVNLGAIDQYGEISDIRWLDLASIKTFDYNNRLGEFATKILDAFKEH